MNKTITVQTYDGKWLHAVISSVKISSHASEVGTLWFKTDTENDPIKLRNKPFCKYTFILKTSNLSDILTMANVIHVAASVGKFMDTIKSVNIDNVSELLTSGKIAILIYKNDYDYKEAKTLLTINHIADNIVTKLEENQLPGQSAIIQSTDNKFNMKMLPDKASYKRSLVKAQSDGSNVIPIRILMQLVGF
jgi:hypothetical protein